MKIRHGLLIGFVCAAAVLALVLITRTQAPRITAAAPSGVPAHGLTHGFTLASVDVTLPEDDGMFPSGPHADIVNANCLPCHSASMVLYQPPLSAADWRKAVEKMRDVYGAPVEAADIPAIIAYLAAMSARRKAAR